MTAFHIDYLELFLGFCAVSGGLYGMVKNRWDLAAACIAVLIYIQVTGIHDRIDILEARALPSSTQEASQ